ncbi:MAG: histidine kinase dimerization/phospho-acceptor domain-containing protein [Niameybacter sp.]
MEIILISIIGILGIVLWVQHHQKVEMTKNIKYIAQKLEEIMANDSLERIKVLTESTEIKGLVSVINEGLDYNHKNKMKYNRTKQSMKKMLSNISHDLKTPLTVILGYTEMLQATTKEKDRVDKIYFKATEVLELINKFFDLAKLEIEEYRNKTMNLMFMYPINRKKILMAKFIIVMGFVFVNILISELIIILVLAFIDRFVDIVAGYFTMSMLISEVPKLFVNAGGAALMVLIPLYFGVKKMSISTTIVSSVLLVCIMCSGNSEFSLSTLLPFTITVAVVGLFLGIDVLNKLEKQDVL